MSRPAEQFMGPAAILFGITIAFIVSYDFSNLNRVATYPRNMAFLSHNRAGKPALLESDSIRTSEELLDGRMW